MAQPDALARAYRRRVEAVHAEVLRRLEALYGEELDPDAIADSMARWIDRAEPVLAAGQASIASLAEAYLASRAADAGLELDFDEVTAELAGTTRQGNALLEAMAALGPMILGQIGAGHSPEEATEFGRFAIERFADNELTGIEDRIHEDPAVQTRLTGWDCTVSPDACDGCLENAGIHELTWLPYRHGDCRCEVEAVFGATA